MLGKVDFADGEINDFGPLIVAEMPVGGGRLLTGRNGEEKV